MKLAAGTVVAGRYRLVRELGQGAYGSVFEAERDDGVPVAVKVMLDRHAANDAEALRFEREAALLVQLRHPNVVEFYDFGHSAEGLPFIAFELLAGRTLRDELRVVGRMAAGRAAGVVRQILDALDAAHRRGIIHRDIKPANVFLCAGDVVKVLDFGLAKPLRSGGDASLTATGQMIGTPHYMAPESVRGEKNVDTSVDVYAVGAVLAELMSGAKLVPGSTDIELYMEHISDAPFELPAELVGTPLGAIVARAVAKKAGERFRSAGEMLAALEAADVGLAALDDAAVAARVGAIGFAVKSLTRQDYAGCVVATLEIAGAGDAGALMIYDFNDDATAATTFAGIRSARPHAKRLEERRLIALFLQRGDAREAFRRMFDRDPA
jgi:eukaryotic-like serine/threonine-protein kinase